MNYVNRARAGQAKIDSESHPLLQENAALLPFKRFVFVSPEIVPEANVYQAIHKTVKTRDFGKYQKEHSHDVDETYLFIGDNEDLSGLKAEVVLNGVEHVVESPSSVFIPKGLRHKYRFLEGSGLLVVTLLKRKYSFQK